MDADDQKIYDSDQTLGHREYWRRIKEQVRADGGIENVPVYSLQTGRLLSTAAAEPIIDPDAVFTELEIQ